MAANDYRGYLRNHMDMEHGGSRFQPPTQSAHRPLIFGTLAVMGLLQVASSVTILLHLTGYLREVSHAKAHFLYYTHWHELQHEPVRDALKISATLLTLKLLGFCFFLLGKFEFSAQT